MLGLNIVLWQTIIAHWENGNHTDDYSPFMMEYLAHGEAILRRYEENDDVPIDGDNSARPDSGPSTSS